MGGTLDSGLIIHQSALRAEVNLKVVKAYQNKGDQYEGKIPYCRCMLMLLAGQF